MQSDTRCDPIGHTWANLSHDHYDYSLRASSKLIMTCYEPQLTTFWSFLDNFGIELDRGRILDRPSLTKNDQESEKKCLFDHEKPF